MEDELLLDILLFLRKRDGFFEGIFPPPPKLNLSWQRKEASFFHNQGTLSKAGILGRGTGG